MRDKSGDRGWRDGRGTEEEEAERKRKTLE